MDKFRNKYRIASVRLKSWDYGTNAAYFITICTQSMKHFFGEIVDGEMQLNEMGQLAEKYWLEIPIHFPFIELGNLVVMPNHIHGILIINKIDKPINALQIAETQLIDTPQTAETRLIASQPAEMDTPMNTPIAETRLIASVLHNTNTPMNMQLVKTRLIASQPNKMENNGGISGDKNPMLHENISRIIRWYKGRCSFELRKTHPNFTWHTRFYEHIIRDAKSFENIQDYIENNPLQWHKDKFYDGK